jgi:hypothetical protein
MTFRYKKKINQHNKTKRKFKILNCHPKTKKELPFSCLNKEQIMYLLDRWNTKNQKNKIITTINTPLKIIWQKLKQKMLNICDKESCWIDKLDDKKIIKKCDIFSPKSPETWKKNPNEWLSNFDIENVTKQYEDKYKCFSFFGPTPIDFDLRDKTGKCVCNTLCNFNISDEIKKGKFKFGIIFNTDPHDKSGSHWISLFINLKKKQIFFFDSAGDKAPIEISNFVKRIKEQCLLITPPIHLTYDENYPVQHQKSNTECGMYSLFFIIHMLEDKFTSFYYKKHILKDEYIEKFRNIYFN